MVNVFQMFKTAPAEKSNAAGGVGEHLVESANGPDVDSVEIVARKLSSLGKVTVAGEPYKVEEPDVLKTPRKTTDQAAANRVLSDHNEALRRDTLELENELHRSDTEKRSAEQTAKQEAGYADKLAVELDSALSKITTLTKALREAEQAEEKARIENENLQAQVKQMRQQQQASFAAEVEDSNLKNKELDKLRTQLESFASTIQEQKATIEKLQQKVDENNEVINKLKQQIDKVNQTLVDRDATITELNAKLVNIDTAAFDNDTTSEEKAELQKEIDQLLEQNDSLVAVIKAIYEKIKTDTVYSELVALLAEEFDTPEESTKVANGN